MAGLNSDNCPMSGDAEKMLGLLTEEWERVHVLSIGDVTTWDWQVDIMSAEVIGLKNRGDWCSGGHTLLSALRVHHNEVMLCRGLAWLLGPDGRHGLSHSFLQRFLALLDIDTSDIETAIISTEEQRGSTRADIVIRTDARAILVEAKVWAGEQPHQAERLDDEWSHEEPVLVFLTRDGRLPTSTPYARHDWHGLSWADVARVLDEAIGERPDCAPGAREYLETLSRYGGDGN